MKITEYIRTEQNISEQNNTLRLEINAHEHVKKKCTHRNTHPHHPQTQRKTYIPTKTLHKHKHKQIEKQMGKQDGKKIWEKTIGKKEKKREPCNGR